MEIKLIYSKTQLDSTVKFISDNNENFLGKDDYIRKTILKYMDDMVQDNDLTYLGTMGFTLFAEKELENIDNDENTCHIEILVDPALSNEDRWLTGDLHQEVVIIENKTTKTEITYEG